MKYFKRLSYFKPLLLWLIAVGIVWFVLQFHMSTMPDGRPKIGDPVDMVLLAVLAFGSGALVIVTLVGTRVWTTRGIGLFGIFIGDFMVWTTVFISRARHMPTPEGVSDALRAVFLASIPMMLYGIAGYIGESRSFSEKTNTRQDVREVNQNDERKSIIAQQIDLNIRRVGMDEVQISMNAQQAGIDERQVGLDLRQESQDAHDAEGRTS